MRTEEEIRAKLREREKVFDRMKSDQIFIISGIKAIVVQEITLLKWILEEEDVI